MRQIYRIYPPEKICQTLSGEFEEFVRVVKYKNTPEKSQGTQSTAPFFWYERALPQRIRTQMTRIRRIFTDTYYPCVSVSSAQSVFHPKNPYNHISVFIHVHPRLNESNQSPQKAQSIATIIFASFALFAVRFINILNKLSSIGVPSAFIGVHPQLIDRTAPAESR
jgi:hypothetical protein